MLGPTSMGEKIIHDVYVIHQSFIHHRNVFQKCISKVQSVFYAAPFFDLSKNLNFEIR